VSTGVPGTGYETTVEAAVEAALPKLDLETKVRLLTGADFWSTYAVPEIGLRQVIVSDGPAGVKGGSVGHDETTTSLPSPTALAASWDEQLVREIGELLAGEARRKGVDVVLGPTINLQRSPVGGRHFEQFSEDPLLTGRIACAYVRGLQSRGVGGCPKHYVCNDSETDRQNLNVDVAERPLRELYMAPFERTVREAETWSVMAAYNGVRGMRMTESDLQTDPLKSKWGFDGVVVSDWYATKSTVPAGRAALDLVMPGPDGPWGEKLLAAVRAGDVSEAAIDDKVRRLLRLAARVGLCRECPRPHPWPSGRPRPRYRRWSGERCRQGQYCSVMTGCCRSRRENCGGWRCSARTRTCHPARAAVARTCGPITRSPHWLACVRPCRALSFSSTPRIGCDRAGSSW